MASCISNREINKRAAKRHPSRAASRRDHPGGDARGHPREEEHTYSAPRPDSVAKEDAVNIAAGRAGGVHKAMCSPLSARVRGTADGRAEPPH